MDSKDIKPAISIANGQPIDNEDFQRLLFNYFESKGIMSDLRAHLRSQMIHVLKDTTLGKSIISKKHELSPKVQAINLLIAEYLLQRNYHYTLSVMSSEVPLTSVFPPINVESNESPETAFRFSDDDLWDILEALGATRIPELAESLGVKYRSQEHVSLLICILQYFPGIPDRNNIVKSRAMRSWLSRHRIHNMDLEHLIRMFKETGIDLDIVLQIIELLKTVITNEVARLKELKDQEVLQLKQQLSYEAATKLQKYKLKFTTLEAFYKSEKKRLQDELKQAQENLSTCAKNVQEKYNDVNALNENIKVLEMRLLQQEQTLVLKEQSLQQRQESLENKQKHFDMKIELMKKTMSQNQLEIAVDDDGKASTSEVMADRVASEQERLKMENLKMQQSQSALHDEIAILRHQNSEYKMKIDELLSRTSMLLVELESRSDHQWSSLVEGKKRDVLSHSILNPNYHIANEAQKSLASTYLPGRQSILSVLHEYINCEDSMADNNTEQVLMEARERLLELERESDEIDEHFETVTTFATSPYECSANIIVQKFHNNIAMLRNSFKSIFTNIHPIKAASMISIRKCQDMPKEHSDELASLTAMKEFDENCTKPILSKEDPPVGGRCEVDTSPRDSSSPVSTVLNINSSLSTVDVSPGNASDANNEID